MTVQEAIDWLKAISVTLGINDFHKSSVLKRKEALHMAIESMKKQIPKKPIEDDTSYSGYKCPTCNSNIYQLRSHNIMQTPYCIFCGQALKWGEEDEV